MSGHFLFSSISGLYLMQQLPWSQETVLCMNMQFLVVSDMCFFLTDESPCARSDQVRQDDPRFVTKKKLKMLSPHIS